DRVGIKLSPTGRFNDMFDSDPLALVSYLLPELQKRNVAFVEVVGGSEDGHLYDVHGTDQIPDNFKAFRSLFKNTLIGNKDLTFEKANDLIKEGTIDMASYGRYYLSNPDVVERFENGWELAQPEYQYMFSGGEKGYAEYPRYRVEKD